MTKQLPFTTISQFPLFAKNRLLSEFSLELETLSKDERGGVGRLYIHRIPIMKSNKLKKQTSFTRSSLDKKNIKGLGKDF